MNIIINNMYTILSKQTYQNDLFCIVQIRKEDRFLIMKWRNEQLYHLRQKAPLTEAGQDAYFNNIVAKLFDEEQPDQILFSYLEDGKCIGYGGLVHINWQDRNAEISFVMDTSLEKEYFELHWKQFLGLLEEVAFKDLQLHKIYTYAFDLRPHLYPIFESKGFCKEAELKQHVLFEGEYKSVIIHGKVNINEFKF